MVPSQTSQLSHLTKLHGVHDSDRYQYHTPTADSQVSPPKPITTPIITATSPVTTATTTTTTKTTGVQIPDINHRFHDICRILCDAATTTVPPAPPTGDNTHKTPSATTPSPPPPASLPPVMWA
nr:unnamed protein product [Spirometra erinaceieuropaei]VZI33334.1 unnamed protein product [Spirometra erinaceieuropaei]